MSGHDASVALKPASAMSGGVLLQRKCACGSHASGGECSKCKQKRLQRKPGGREQAGVSPPSVDAVLREPGRAMNDGARDFFESRFGHDFSQVRVHTDAGSSASASAVQARAYTVGEHIVFGQGQYDPASKAGQLLLAHELTHVLQQRPGLRRAPLQENQASAVEVSRADNSVVRRQPYPGVITRCRDQGVPCPAPYFHHGTVCRLVDCYSAATRRLPYAISPGVCVYHCNDGKVCACVLVGSQTSAVCTFTFCDDASRSSAEPDTQGIAERALAMAGEQQGQGGSEQRDGAQASAATATAQARLEIGAVDDPLEREADSVASRVVEGTGTAPSVSSVMSASPLAVMPALSTPRADGGKQLRRLPDMGAGQADPAHIRSHGGTLPYREATELQECVRIMGADSADYCREQVLGEHPDPPRFTQVAGITSPQPRGTRARADGSTHFTVGNVVTTFQPDAQTTDTRLNGRAETRIVLRWGAIHYRTDGANRITSFTGPGIAQATIQTTYGAGATPTGTSGYGRGTTAADRSAGHTSLGFHEGNHGIDFMDYLGSHPFPAFGGSKGMTETAFQAAIATYTAAANSYYASIQDYSVQNTDCAGFTIDQSNAAAASANGGTAQATMCRPAGP